MHHGVGAIEPIYWYVEAENEDPSIGTPAAIVDKFSEDKLRARLRSHDQEDDSPSDSGKDVEYRTKNLEFG